MGPRPSSRRRDFLLPSLLSGLALWFSFPNVSFFPLAWVALIPYLHFLLRRHPWKWVIAGHFLMSGVYFAGVLYWIPNVLGTYGNLRWAVAQGIFLLMVLTLAMFLLPFSLLVRWAAGRSAGRALLCAPGMWLLTELGRNYYAVNGFPWALLGYSQYPYDWVIQIADIGGVYLISFMVVAGNCALLGALWFRSWKPLLLVTPFFLIANLYGAYRLHWWQVSSEIPVQVALVQGNIALSEGKEYYAKKYFEDLPAYYREAVGRGAQWVIFPEAQNPYSYGDDFYFKSFWERLVRNSGAYLLFNSTLREEGTSSGYFNSAVLLDRNGQQAYRYDKVHLVPFGEYVPLEKWLHFAKPLVQEVSGFSAGNRFELGTVFDTRFGTLICYESIFPEMSRRFVQEGAQVLVNLTNDLWFGATSAPRQHLTMSAFRAIENRKPLLRCANSGYSVIVSPLGRVQKELGLFEEGMLLAEVAGNRHRSVYSRLGEWLNVSIIIGSLCLPLARGKGKADVGRPSSALQRAKKKDRSSLGVSLT